MRVLSVPRADKILDAAVRLFGARRFHEVRMDDIAAEARVGKGTLYRYFTDKDELYFKLVERASVRFTQSIRQAAGGPGSMRARLVCVARAVIEFFEEQPHLLELIQRTELLRGQGVNSPWRGAREELFQRTSDLFAEGVRRQEFQIANPEVAMMLLLGGIRTILHFGKRPRPARLAEDIVETLLGADHV
jgi:TetR/AcrR family fatty acid metabolism transcriptional regulator